MEDLIRLNLGCGNKKLDGWVGVDAKEADVISDLRELPFKDNYADKAMAVHVLEHFYVWEAPEVLKEWIRVLKPGGKLIIEVPDLQKTIDFMANGETAPNLTMWPLYGDPSHRDPLMCHKWAYTPHSLAKMMAYSGLENLERQPAQFHLKEKRDMRVVGFKHVDIA